MLTRMLFALALAATPFVCSADDKPAAPAANEKTAEAKPSDTTVTFKVTGMDCPHCAKSVATAYEKVKGVAQAIADNEKGTLIVKYDSTQVTEATLLEALKEKPKYAVTKLK